MGHKHPSFYSNTLVPHTVGFLMASLVTVYDLAYMIVAVSTLKELLDYDDLQDCLNATCSSTTANREMASD